MSDETERQRRKQIKESLRKKEAEAFERTFPMERVQFEKLFDFLEEVLPEKGCDHTLALTEAFFAESGETKITQIKEWLGEHGAYCDCEVLVNTEEYFLSLIE